ncbi:hypothetical protein [uncultured Brevundimonas sp.]|uniref:hypothetical protein n=1 Tax=uncultured Brevundimonas sp. TaxID=213418 RepID=UPI0025D28AA1|nr:hypothetical protein [uncultured Brevundimonas sp.]
MTDPNRPIDPQERPEVVHHTTINAAPERRSSGGGALAFIVGGLVVAALVIGFIVFSNGGFGGEAKDTNVDVDVNLPELPEAPKMPDMPNIEPPSVPQPNPAPSN